MAETFQLGAALGNLVYTSDANGWTVADLGNGFFGIKTTGTYTSNLAGNDPTRGFLDISFQNVQAGQSNFSASGGTVPEPGSMALLGAACSAWATWPAVALVANLQFFLAKEVDLPGQPPFFIWPRKFFEVLK